MAAAIHVPGRSTRRISPLCAEAMWHGDSVGALPLAPAFAHDSSVSKGSRRTLSFWSIGKAFGDRRARSPWGMEFIGQVQLLPVEFGPDAGRPSLRKRANYLGTAA